MRQKQSSQGGVNVVEVYTYLGDKVWVLAVCGTDQRELPYRHSRNIGRRIDRGQERQTGGLHILCAFHVVERVLFSTSQEPKPQVPCFRDNYSYKHSHKIGTRKIAQRLGALTALFKRT